MPGIARTLKHQMVGTSVVFEKSLYCDRSTSPGLSVFTYVQRGIREHRDVQETRMKTRLACLFAAFATLVVPDLAHACGNGAVQFADDFKNPDAGWLHSDHSKIGSGAITLMPPVKAYTTAYNNIYLFSDADVCAQIKVDDFAKPEQMSGGLMFWMTDTNNYYVFLIYPSGGWKILRLVGERSISIGRGNSDAIKKGAGDLNEIELRLSGNTGTGYVNGSKVATFNGQPPEGGGYFGVMAESEDERTNIWELRDFRILKLQ
jgi:hypothetical protein